MKKLTLNLNDSTFKMLEEITKYHNKEAGSDVSNEKTLEHLIYAHYMCEVKIGKNPQNNNGLSITVTITN
ncbi:hypothetical protein ACIQY5_19165 [Peribacillus frigoritolerans]|uniref:hypothetical protein n=1 Tax=Peribacillus frigoritolerans TaxID=450367 RepID=UPI00380C0DCC